MGSGDLGNRTEIEVPGRPTSWKTYNIPPERVTLPLVAGAHFWTSVMHVVGASALGLLMLLMGFVFLVLVEGLWTKALLLATAASVILAGRLTYVAAVAAFFMFGIVGSIAGYFSVEFVAAPAGLLFGLFGWFGFASAYFALHCLIRGSPLLVINRGGFWDLRAGQAIAWSEVAKAQHNAAGVVMRLKTSTFKRHAFPYGPGRGLWFKAQDIAIIPLGLLEYDEHTLAQTMLTMVKKHGGEIVRWDQPI